MSDTTNLSETDKAYFAGLIDANGTINIQRSYRKGIVIGRQILLDIENLSQSQVAWVKARFKGTSIRQRENGQRYAARFKTRWAASALVDVSSYVLGKQKEIRLVFKFASVVSRHGKRLTPEQEIVRAEVDRELTALKRGA